MRFRVGWPFFPAKAFPVSVVRPSVEFGRIANEPVMEPVAVGLDPSDGWARKMDRQHQSVRPGNLTQKSPGNMSSGRRHGPSRSMMLIVTLPISSARISTVPPCLNTGS